MKTWIHDCHSTVSQPAIHKSSKMEKSSKNDVSRTNSKITMCWSIASFRHTSGHTSGPRGRVHHLKSGTLNTASRLLPTGLMVIPFRIHIQSSSSGTSARSNVSLTNEKHAQKIDIKTEKTSSIQIRACVGSVAQLHEWLHVALVYRVMRRKVMPTDSHNYWTMVSDSIQSHDVVDETWKEKRTYKTGNERWK